MKNDIRIGCGIILALQELLGKRLAAHYTIDGVKAYYRVTPDQIISISANLGPSAEREYNNLPEYYKGENNVRTNGSKN